MEETNKSNTQPMDLETLVNDLNSLIENSSELFITLDLSEMNYCFDVLIADNNQIQRYIHIYAKAFHPIDRHCQSQSVISLKYFIYCLLYLLIKVSKGKDNKLKKLKYYYQSLITLYHHGCVSIECLVSITKVMLIIDKHYDYHFALVNIIIKSITNKTNYTSLLPVDFYDILITSFNDPQCEYHLNKPFLLLLSLNLTNAPDLKQQMLTFLIRIFKHNYDLSFTSFMVNKLLKANFAFKSNSITLISNLIDEEEDSRLSPSFFIKKGFILQNNNPIIISPITNLSNEFTLLFSFRFNGPSSGDPNDKAVLFEIKSCEQGKSNKASSFNTDKTLMELFISNQKLHCHKNQRSSHCTDLIIEPNKDYSILLTQKKKFTTTLYITLNGINEASFNNSLPSFTKCVSLSFGQNFDGVIGTIILINTSYQSKSDPDFSRHIMNLYEDYDLLYRIDHDLTEMKQYSNRVIQEDKKYFAAFQYLKNRKIKVDYVISPNHYNRFNQNGSYFRLNNNTVKVRLENHNETFKVKAFNQYTIFQFLQYEGLKYIALLFGLLSNESNDDINVFIDTVLSFLFKLIDVLGEKYFKNQLNVLFTLILNYIASNEKVKLNRGLFKSLTDKINCFNITDEIKIRNCLVKLLLVKSIYWEPLTGSNAISLFSCVYSCIQSNPTGLIKKTIVNQLLSFAYVIETNDSSKAHYKKLLKELALTSIRNKKTKIFDSLITHIITKGDEGNEMLNYKLLKIVYLHFANEDIVMNNNEFVSYLVSQFEGKAKAIDHCKWCSMTKCICYLIILDYINKTNEFRKKFVLYINRLCMQYPSMQMPSNEFFRCVFVQYFKQTLPNVKVDYIKGKATFRDLKYIPNANVNTKDKLFSTIKAKLKSFEKYIEIVYERFNANTTANTTSITVMPSIKSSNLLSLFHSMITDMLNALSTNTIKGNKNNITDPILQDTIKSLFSSNALLNYMIFLFKKYKDKQDIFLIDIIDKTLRVISNPFYFPFLVHYYENDVDREDDPQINTIVSTLTKMLSSSSPSDQKAFINNQHMMIITLYQIISIGQLIVSKSLEKCTIAYLHFISKNTSTFSLKTLFAIGTGTKAKMKNVYDMIIEIVIMLFKYNSYSNQYIDLFNTVIKVNETTTVFYLYDYDYKTKSSLSSSSSSNKADPNDYSLCIYFLLKFINILYEEKDNDPFFEFVKQMAIITADNARHLYSKIKSRNPIQSTYITDRDYIDIVMYIEKKVMDWDFDALIRILFERFNSKKMAIALRSKPSSTTVRSKNVSSVESSMQSELMITRRNSNSLETFFNFAFEAPNESNEFNTTCDTLTTAVMTRKKRSMSQQNKAKIKNNIFNKTTVSQENTLNGSNGNSIFNQKHLFFIDDNEKDSIKQLFNLRHSLIWNTFPIMLKDYIFSNKTFKSMRRCYNELYPIKNEHNALKELDYPTKVMNYVSKAFYKPFIKPDLKFYSNQLYPLSHDYYSKATDDTMIQFSFKKIIPRIDKILFRSYCELFTPLGTIYSEVILSPNFVLIMACCDKDIRYKSDTPIEAKMKYLFSADENDIVTTSEKKILFYIDDIEEVLPRRCYLQWIGIEFFLCNRRSYCINLFNEESKTKFITELTNITTMNSAVSSSVTIVSNLEKEFKKNDYTKQWLDNKLPTFDYLLLVNKYSSRTYNDIYQYPIFPWLICDSDCNPRDLSSVICEQPQYQNIKGRETLMAQLPASHMAKNTNLNIYCFHYSTGGHILYYFVRHSPFTYSHIKFQSNKFDSSSRLFTSIKGTLAIFTLLKETRELTPEFFYDANFLINLNKNNLGYVKSKELRLNDVFVDDMAKIAEDKAMGIDYRKSSIQFVIEQRVALEQVEDIGVWINNIFGYYQMKIGGRPAQFKKLTYEKNHDYNEKFAKWRSKDMSEEDIYYKARTRLSMLAFGMTPYQLFNKAHPKRAFVLPSIPSFKFIETKDSNGSNSNSNTNSNNNSTVNNLTNIKQFLLSCKQGDSFRIGLSNNRIYFKSLSHLDIFELNEKDSPLQTITFPRQGHLRFRLSSFCEISNGIFAFCRFFDHTIKIINIDSSIQLSIQCPCFVTSICSIGLNEFVTGDEYGYLTKWRLRNKDIHADFSFKSSHKVLGHNNAVLKMNYEQRHDIIISVDEMDICVIHNATTLDLINVIEVNEKIRDVKLSYLDMLFFLCERKKGTGKGSQVFYCYSLNGLMVSKSKAVNGNGNGVEGFELGIRSDDVFIAQGAQVYKTRMFDFDICVKDESHPAYVFSEEEKGIKEMVLAWEMKMGVFVFVDNTITFRQFE